MDRLRLLVVALAAGWLAFAVRDVHVLGRPLAGAPGAGPGWVESVDADSQYHARRVLRALEDGGAVAQRDPLLAWPLFAGAGGAPIPWPPYYDAALAAVARLRAQGAVAAEVDAGPPPAAASEAARAVARAAAADTVARAPQWLAALTAALAALAAAGLARRAGGAADGRAPAEVEPAAPRLVAAAVAGLGVALSFAHLRYSYLGMGDHHTAASALHLGLLVLVARGVVPGALRGPRLSALRGASAGLVAGALLGTWVAGLTLVVPVQAALAWLLLRPGPPAPVGLALFTASFHKATVLALLPAVLVSPWAHERPLDVVNLSWFHVAWFGVSWLAFAPVVFLPRAGARRAPALVAAALLGALLLAAREGAREALDWAAAGNVFMASITESQPFESPAAAAKWLGLGAWLVGPALVVAARRARGRGDDRFVVWLAALVPLLCAAALQRRFAEGLAAPLAVALGWLAAAAWRARGPLLGLAVAALALAHVGTLRATAGRLGGPRFVATPVARAHDALAAALAPLRDLAPEARRGVLAEWDHGHAIEWWGAAPTLATNFGLYLGEDAFLDPWRFLQSDDDVAAEALLARRDASHVLVTRDAPRNAAAARAALGLAPLDGAAWRRSLVARLLAVDPGDADPHPAFLRLVAAAPLEAGGPAFTRLFERVAGARLAVLGAPGERARLRLRVDDGAAGFLWAADGLLDGEGRLELRVPYPTEHAGVGTASQAELVVGGRLRAVAIGLHEVREGATIAAGPESAARPAGLPPGDR